VDLITVTKANCAQPMNYYQSLLVTMLCFKSFVLLVIFVAWLVPLANMRLRAYRQWLSVPKHLRSSSARRRFKRRLVAPMQRRRSILGRLRSTDWVKVRRVFAVGFLGCWLHVCSFHASTSCHAVFQVCCMCAACVLHMCVRLPVRMCTCAWMSVPGQVFRVVSMVLFIAYPSVSIKLLRLFNCINVAGGWYLQDDVRLECFNSEWYVLIACPMLFCTVCGPWG
jgi:hypothetical protein